MASSATLSARNRLGATVRHHPDDHDRITDARRDLAAAKLAEFVKREVAKAPPLSEAQRSALAALLRPSAGGAA